MPIDTLLSRQKNPLEKLAVNKRAILYNHEPFINSYLQKLSIDKYVLFIKKRNSYQVATWHGYPPHLVEQIMLTENAVLIELMYLQQSLLSLTEVLNHYHSAQLIAKENGTHIKEEKAYWDKLDISHFTPIYIENELIGFFLFHTGKPSIKNNTFQELLDLLKVWANSFYELYIEQEHKEKLKRYLSFVEFTSAISQKETPEAIQDKAFTYILELINSTHAIWFYQKGHYLTPVKFCNIDYLKSYKRKEIKDILQSDYYYIDGRNSLLGKEFGRGIIQIISINSRHLIIAKAFEQIHDNPILQAVCQLTGRLLLCPQNSLKKQSS